MSDDFAGKVVLVTGSAQGIGSAIARAFPGATVWVTDIEEEPVDALAREIGGRAARLDVTDEAGVAALVQRIVAEHGRIDVLVHCAGGVRGQVGRPIESVPEADWHAILAANATGAFLIAKHVAPIMKRQGSGRIVTISSGAGLRPSLTGIQAYAAAKHALVGLTKQLAQELGPHGITVNSVGARLRSLEPCERTSVGELWRRGAETTGGRHLHAPARHAGGYRVGCAVLRVRAVRLDH